jgi:hypothetical protein
MAPVAGSVVIAACTSTTTSSPVVVCGPDNVATTNWDVVATTNYEAAWYYASLDAIPVGFYSVASADVTPDQYPAPPPISTTPPGAGPTPAPPPITPPAATPPAPAPTVTIPIVDAGVAVPPLDAGAAPAVASSAAAATTVAASVGRYFPNGCATATATGNVVTFHLNNCSGPLGLLASTGTVTATITIVSSAVQIQLAGNNIAANGATINLATSGTLTATASGQKTLQANTHSNGTGPDGNAIAHSGMYTLVWPTGVGCATLNGTLTGVGSGAFGGTTTTITNYVACTNKCPQSGTTMSSFNGGTVTLAFNGSNTAQCTSSLGTSASIQLNCP